MHCIEVGENYYCGSLVEFNKDKEAFKTRLRDNKLIGKDDLGFGQLLIGSGDELQNEIATILITKYDKNNKEFYGLDSDFIDQMWLATELANIKCAGECQLVGETLTEQIYNILIK